MFVNNNTNSSASDIENSSGLTVVEFVGHTFLDGTISLNTKFNQAFLTNLVMRKFDISIDYCISLNKLTEKEDRIQKKL